MEAYDIDYGILYYRSDDNDECKFSAYGTLASFYLKLSKGRISPIKVLY